MRERELNVIRCASMGYTDSEIADENHISIGYVRKILNELYDRTQTRNKAHLIGWAYRNKVLGG